jgi:L-histidine N-alpha-methyltransferase
MIAIEVHLDADTAAKMASDVHDGLSAQPKELAPKYFYDERGSQLFEQITELEEYYPTRAERSILAERSGEIIAAAGAPRSLVELGSGSAAKTRHLLDAMREAECLHTYVPVDISEEITHETAALLVEEYPGLAVRGLVCDFEQHLERIPNGDGGRLVAFLGGTIGNLYPRPRHEFLVRLRELMGPADRLLLGTDLVKGRERLEAAYDDASGVTAEFNKNVLAVLNREVNADFDVASFDHVARWDAEAQWIEMRLRATRAMDVNLTGLGIKIHFERGEELRTEVSAKFTWPGITAELAEAGFELIKWYTDPQERFAVSLARAAG